MQGQRSLARPSSLFFYAFGNLSPAIKQNLLGAPIFYYYNAVLGLEAWLVSLALAIALTIDGITDPMLGYMSDHTRSRLGRRHGYIYASIIPGALFYFLLLVMEVGSSQLALFLQLLVLISGLRIAWTFYDVPRQALGAEISKDYHQRTQMYGLNMFFGWIGGAGIAYATQAVFLGESYDNIDGYRSLAYWGGGIILLTGILFSLGIHREIPNLEPPADERAKSLREIVREIVATLNHRSWLVLFMSGVVFSIYIGLASGLSFYFNRFFWDWKPKEVAIWVLADLGAALLISLFAKPLARSFDKKRLAVWIFSISIAVGPLLLVLRLCDLWYGTELLPPNGTEYGALWWIMFLHQFFLASIGVLAWVLVGSMTADVVEDSQRETGRRSEGLFFAGPALIQKSLSGLGLVIKGVILTAVGFSAAATEAENIVAIEKLGAVFVVIAVLLPATSVWIFSHYEITREGHAENLAELGYTSDGGDAPAGAGPPIT